MGGKSSKQEYRDTIHEIRTREAIIQPFNKGIQQFQEIVRKQNHKFYRWNFTMITNPEVKDLIDELLQSLKARTLFPDAIKLIRLAPRETAKIIYYAQDFEQGNHASLQTVEQKLFSRLQQ